jgi:hypothetical protein
MTYDAFRALVRKMRAAQNRYFKSRDPNAIKEARRLETEVDRAIERGGMESMFDADERSPQ